MLQDSPAFSSFSVDDAETARRFYTEVLGLDATPYERMRGMLRLHLGSGADVMVYEKPGHAPASHTVLTFPVPDVEAAVDGLTARGVRFARYDGFGQDAKGISRGRGPDIAWFTDPAGNTLAVVQGAASS